jgi:hypothetical protein
VGIRWSEFGTEDRHSLLCRNLIFLSNSRTVTSNWAVSRCIVNIFKRCISITLKTFSVVRVCVFCLYTLIVVWSVPLFCLFCILHKLVFFPFKQHVVKLFHKNLCFIQHLTLYSCSRFGKFKCVFLQIW